jgi:hypothetical protein
MASGGMIYTQNFINLGSGFKKSLRRIHIQTHSHLWEEEDDVMGLFLFLKIINLG